MRALPLLSRSSLGGAQTLRHKAGQGRWSSVLKVAVEAAMAAVVVAVVLVAVSVVVVVGVMVVAVVVWQKLSWRQ